MHTIRIFKMDVNCTEQGITAVKHLIAAVGAISFAELVGFVPIFEVMDSNYFADLYQKCRPYLPDVSYLVAISVGIKGLLGLKGPFAKKDKNEKD